MDGSNSFRQNDTFDAIQSLNMNLSEFVGRSLSYQMSDEVMFDDTQESLDGMFAKITDEKTDDFDPSNSSSSSLGSMHSSWQNIEDLRKHELPEEMIGMEFEVFPEDELAPIREESESQLLSDAVSTSDIKDDRPLRKTCNNCAIHHKKCSGGPAPCSRCVKREMHDCSFHRKRKPGVKQGQKTSKKTETVKEEEKEFRCEGSLLDLTTYRTHDEVLELVNSLKQYNFMGPSHNLVSACRNQRYYFDCLSVAVEFWKSHVNNQLTVGKDEFVKAMIEFQKRKEIAFDGFTMEVDYKLKEDDLNKLWDLVASQKQQVDSIFPDRVAKLTKPQMGLVILWLGPANAKNVIPAPVAIQSIHNFISSEPERRSCYTGFASRQEACEILSESVQSHRSAVVFRLNEGRMETVTVSVNEKSDSNLHRLNSDQQRQLRIRGNFDRNEYYMRNLVRSRYPISETVPDETTEFVHELMFPVTIPNDETSEITAAESSNMLQYTRNARYSWMH